ncbi:MAG: hypothetical protein EPO09_14260 [Aquabacterium sp.]|uniref:hypothetical protein n=1 Tax=Aquabacterium sp. TaxID=1872578 RepID=UPI0012271DEF|nr:hypothetical protein [Aquabacterium sp.]TAK92920.1 MAG: hypothetical protein EPO09_14260 [Aquabacterium sp.]
MRYRVCGSLNALVLLGLMALLPWPALSGEVDLRGIGDPTRPPPRVVARQAGAGGAGSGSPEVDAVAAAAAASAASAAAAEAEATARALTLSGIRINLDRGDGVAVIGDEVVKVGDKVHGMTVVSITHDTVELKGPTGARRLTLPDVIDQSRAPARAAKRGRKDKK